MLKNNCQATLLQTFIIASYMSLIWDSDQYLSISIDISININMSDHLHDN